jgi:hypothetical protein
MEQQHGAPILHMQRQDVGLGDGLLGRANVVAQVVGEIEIPFTQLISQISVPSRHRADGIYRLDDHTEEAG